MIASRLWSHAFFVRGFIAAHFFVGKEDCYTKSHDLNRKRKVLQMFLKILCFVLYIAMFMSSVGCAININLGENNIHQKVDITVQNYAEYFSVTVKDDFEDWTSALGSKNFTHSLTVECRALITASFDHVVIEGRLQLPVDKTHLLYREGKMPVTVKLIVDGGGIAIAKTSVTHGTGPYGGFGVNDFYFECTSASGTIIVD